MSSPFYVSRSEAVYTSEGLDLEQTCLVSNSMPSPNRHCIFLMVIVIDVNVSNGSSIDLTKWIIGTDDASVI